MAPHVDAVILVNADVCFIIFPWTAYWGLLLQNIPTKEGLVHVRAVTRELELYRTLIGA